MGREQRVGILVMYGVKLLDVAGPSEVFSEANRFGASYAVTPYSLARLAAMANVSARHLTRLFHDELKTTPARYVELLRFDTAKDLLDAGHSVTDAAVRSGFGTSETLRRAFIQHLGVSPRACQQRFRSAIRN